MKITKREAKRLFNEGKTIQIDDYHICKSFCRMSFEDMLNHLWIRFGIKGKVTFSI